jgi:hypothetical protein
MIIYYGDSVVQGYLILLDVLAAENSDIMMESGNDIIYS